MAHTFFRSTLVGVAALALAGGAQADSVTFTYTDTGGLSAQGSLEITDQGGGVWLATSGTLEILACPPAPALIGTFDLLGGNGGAIWNSPSGGFAYDNLVYLPPVASGYLDVWGLLFMRGTEEVNIWGNSGPGTYTGMNINGQQGYRNDQGDLQIAIVPLPPAAFAGIGGLALTGLVGLRRRAR